MQNEGSSSAGTESPRFDSRNRLRDVSTERHEKGAKEKATDRSVLAKARLKQGFKSFTIENDFKKGITGGGGRRGNFLLRNKPFVRRKGQQGMRSRSFFACRSPEGVEWEKGESNQEVGRSLHCRKALTIFRDKSPKEVP